MEACKEYNNKDKRKSIKSNCNKSNAINNCNNNSENQSIIINELLSNEPKEILIKQSETINNKKESVREISTSINTDKECDKKPLEQILTPLEIITTNNISNRPRSVTASIFATSPKLPIAENSNKKEIENKNNNNNKNSDNIKTITSSVINSKPIIASRKSATSSVFVTIANPLKRPKNATKEVFSPRTDEMNKGFVTFMDDESGLTSK